ncbi:uncharacterized protein LOC127395144 [Apus apus]|uniref:uncharacterized protein LOC127395144 n=1 Tax=Apus apus TaxID=8895 RepID=UPI0021F83431|nr:uncharacterized protein LOC127395144 [Apus apus]
MRRRGWGGRTEKNHFLSVRFPPRARCRRTPPLPPVVINLPPRRIMPGAPTQVVHARHTRQNLFTSGGGATAPQRRPSPDPRPREAPPSHSVGRLRPWLSPLFPRRREVGRACAPPLPSPPATLAIPRPPFSFSRGKRGEERCSLGRTRRLFGCYALHAGKGTYRAAAVSDRDRAAPLDGKEAELPPSDFPWGQLSGDLSAGWISSLTGLDESIPVGIMMISIAALFTASAVISLVMFKKSRRTTTTTQRMEFTKRETDPPHLFNDGTRMEFSERGGPRRMAGKRTV